MTGYIARTGKRLLGRPRSRCGIESKLMLNECIVWVRNAFYWLGSWTTDVLCG
jgi:hypothetical protein